jgi:hypothetical protein
MADQGYLYSTVRDHFYTLSGLQSDQGGVLDGDTTVAVAVDNLLASAEMKVLGLLLPFWNQGKVTYLNTLLTLKGWSQAEGGSVTVFALPPDGADTNHFYKPLAGWIDFGGDTGGVLPTGTNKVDLVFKDASFGKSIRYDYFSVPGTGYSINDFVPVYFEGGYMKFWLAPRGTAVPGTNNIFLVYFRCPKYPTTDGCSDLNLSLWPLTVYLMLVDFTAIDGASVDLAVQNAWKIQAVASLGFDPFTGGK